MRVLFVDDDRSVLDGLANVLRRNRREWDMVFAAGGPQALREMTRAPFDAVVADVNMPGISGQELLTHVKEHHPATARIVLSGHVDEGAARRLVHCAHRFLAKPASADAIRDALEGAYRLQTALFGDPVRRIIGAVGQLPSPPGILVDVRRLVDAERSSLDEIADVVSRDPALAAKVIQIVNSAFFSLPRHVVNVAEAVKLIGLDRTYDVVLSSCLENTLLAASRGCDHGELVARQARTARLAREIMMTHDPRSADQAFLAGLLHDIGILVLAAGMPTVLATVLAEAADGARPLHEIESKHLGGATHAAIGAHLLDLWNVPAAVVDSVAYHHTPSRSADSTGLVGAVHVAQALAGDEESLDHAYVAGIGLDVDLPAWRELLERTTDEPLHLR